MINFKLITQVNTGRVDRLKNIIYAKEYTENYTGQLSNWTVEDIELLGREVTDNKTKLITRTVPVTIGRQAISILIGGKEYPVTLAKYNKRWSVFYIKNYEI